MDSLNCSMGLRSTGADEALLGNCAGEWLGSKLTAVVGAHEPFSLGVLEMAHTNHPATGLSKSVAVEPRFSGGRVL